MCMCSRYIIKYMFLRFPAKNIAVSEHPRVALLLKKKFAGSPRHLQSPTASGQAYSACLSLSLFHRTHRAEIL